MAPPTFVLKCNRSNRFQMLSLPMHAFASLYIYICSITRVRSVSMLRKYWNETFTELDKEYSLK